jgi:hypothetical protein
MPKQAAGSRSGSQQAGRQAGRQAGKQGGDGWVSCPLLESNDYYASAPDQGRVSVLGESQLGEDLRLLLGRRKEGRRAKKDYFFDKKKVRLFFTLEFHAAVRGE